jgi:hypothetical protein
MNAEDAIMFVHKVQFIQTLRPARMPLNIMIRYFLIPGWDRAVLWEEDQEEGAAEVLEEIPGTGEAGEEGEREEEDNKAVYSRTIHTDIEADFRHGYPQPVKENNTDEMFHRRE